MPSLLWCLPCPRQHAAEPPAEDDVRSIFGLSVVAGGNVRVGAPDFCVPLKISSRLRRGRGGHRAFSTRNYFLPGQVLPLTSDWPWWVAASPSHLWEIVQVRAPDIILCRHLKCLSGAGSFFAIWVRCPVFGAARRGGECSYKSPRIIPTEKKRFSG